MKIMKDMSPAEQADAQRRHARLLFLHAAMLMLAGLAGILNGVYAVAAAFLVVGRALAAAGITLRRRLDM